MLKIGLEMDMTTISHLTKEQKTAFLQAFVRLANADGNFSEDERSFIKGMAKLCGVDEKEALKIKDDNELVKAVAKIDDRRAALELIKEMCVLAHADDELSDKETMLIGRVGQAMGIEINKIEQISNWVIDRMIWLEEAKLIFEEV